MSVIALLAALAAAVADVGTPTGGGIVIDIFDMQWWQAIGAFAVLLGLSPAPWITALATGRLLFRADLEARLAERDKAYVELSASKDREHAAILAEREARYADQKRASDVNALAADTERKRADGLTEAVLEVVEVVRGNNHLIGSVVEVAREATSQ